MQVTRAHTILRSEIPFLRARTKTAQNDRCKNLRSRLPMTKFIFLDTPPTSNRRRITVLAGDFLLSQVDQLFFAKFDFKVAFAMDPRWSICAGIVPRTRITWRLEQLFKSYKHGSEHLNAYSKSRASQISRWVQPAMYDSETIHVRTQLNGHIARHTR